MSLIVSLRIIDGIVLAGDSMATIMGESRFGVESDVECPKCKHKHKVQGNLPPLSLPAATFSYAQKVLSFCDNFGIGICGGSMFGNKSVYFILRSLERKLKHNGKYPKNVSGVAEVISKELHQLIEDELSSEGRSFDDIPQDGSFFNIQLVGYDDENPKTVNIDVGKTVKMRRY